MVDYSRWNHIEVSDDEDETHPNIDTPSLFRWRHQARVDRMEEQKTLQEAHAKRAQDHSRKLTDTKTKLADAEKSGETSIVADLKIALQGIEKEGDDIKKVDDELKKKEKSTPWNVDTLSKPGFEKTVINKKKPREDEANLTEEEKDQRMNRFIKDNDKSLKHYGMLRRYDDSRLYLKENSHLVCEHTANYLVYWCIQLEMEEKHELMSHVAHQCICMQYILELAKQLDYDPRSCLDSFFTRIQVADAEYKAGFEDELQQLKGRIESRAKDKIADALKQAEEEEKEARLGPGGLDPLEVLESLPDELKKCFETQDIGLLQGTIAAMKEDDAKYHMKRCVDSGLWVPEGGKGGIGDKLDSSNDDDKDETEDNDVQSKNVASCS